MTLTKSGHHGALPFAAALLSSVRSGGTYGRSLSVRCSTYRFRSLRRRHVLLIDSWTYVRAGAGRRNRVANAPGSQEKDAEGTTAKTNKNIQGVLRTARF